MIHVRNLNVFYGSSRILKHISFQMNTGECLVITGSSGCGKSTLAHVLAGLLPNSIPATVDGEAVIAGINLLHSPVELIAQHVGIVFQNPRTHLFHLRVEDEVAFGPRNLGLKEEDTAARVNWALESVGLAELRDQKPTNLSGGQIQRLAIAGALAMKPKVLVLDEPTASLDTPGIQYVIKTLENLKKLGLTIVLMEHRLAEVRRLADRVLIMEDGRIAEQGQFDEVLGDHKTLRQFGLRRPTAESLTDWKRLLVPDHHHHNGKTPMLDLQNLTAGYDGRAIIHDVNLKLFDGEFAALVGDNGAGKSTLALAAAGLLRPMAGKVTVNGNSRPRPGLDIALLFQNPADQLFTDSVDEEIEFGPRNYRRFDKHIHEQTLTSADLLHLRTRRPFTLSIGQQQRTALASCIALRPVLVILDEPTLGQDWRHLQQLMDCLARLNEEGTAILLITHDYKLIHHYARRVILMEAGRVTLDGKIAPVPEERIRAEELFHATC